MFVQKVSLTAYLWQLLDRCRTHDRMEAKIFDQKLFHLWNEGSDVTNIHVLHIKKQIVKFMIIDDTRVSDPEPVFLLGSGSGFHSRQVCRKKRTNYHKIDGKPLWKRDPDPVFPGSGWGFDLEKISDPEQSQPGGVTSLWPGLSVGLSNFPRRVRVADRDLVGSGFQISLDPDPVTAQIVEQKKIAERSLKVIYQKKTWNLWLRNVKKWKRQQFLIKTHHKLNGKFSRQRCLDPDPVFKKCMDPVCPERLSTFFQVWVYIYV